MKCTRPRQKKYQVVANINEKFRIVNTPDDKIFDLVSLDDQSNMRLHKVPAKFLETEKDFSEKLKILAKSASRKKNNVKLVKVNKNSPYAKLLTKLGETVSRGKKLPLARRLLFKKMIHTKREKPNKKISKTMNPIK